MSTICVIPARGGSTRIPRKNIKDFHGKPIIAYSIETAQASGLFDQIIVSTDDVGIAAIAEYYGAEFWMRDPVLGRDHFGTQAVMAECLKGIQAESFDNACCIYATAPLMTVKDLCDGYLQLTGWRHDYVSYVMSVGYPDLCDAGQFYWGQAFSFIGGEPLISTHTRMVHVDADRVCDINTMEDWDRAVKLYEGIRK